MRELQNRQKLRRKMYSIPVLLFLLLVAVFTSKGAYNILIKERQSAKEVVVLSEKIGALAEREEKLKYEVETLETDSGIEEEIKSKFNLARAGEHVALIVEKGDIDASTTPEGGSWWKRFWGGIIGQ
jgi:cell division protein FtsB